MHQQGDFFLKQAGEIATAVAVLVTVAEIKLNVQGKITVLPEKLPSVE